VSRLNRVALNLPEDRTDTLKVPHQLLLADDSLTIQRVIKLTFADEDVTVTAVGDGDRAVAAIDDAPPDIVLADASMPGRSGYDVARYIRDTPHLAHIPVVLLTGASEEVDAARVAMVGCDRVLAKPFDPQEVIAVVRELLAGPKKIAAGYASPPEPDGPVDADPKSPAEIDAYFDSLDLALANLNSSPAPMDGLSPHRLAPESVEGIEPPITPAESAGEVITGAAALSYASDRAAFDYSPQTADLDVDAVESALGGASYSAASDPLFQLEPARVAPVISDALIDEIADRVFDRVMARLSSSNLPDLVTAVAERLVRAEIDEIKGRL
jgi:CheY-like chemotaxis protein